MNQPRQHVSEMSQQPELAAGCNGLAYLTADVMGIGGTIKVQPDDFDVEELPAYRPCGDGEHLFLWVEKRDVAADGLVRHVARALNIGLRDIGVAGLKDRRAVTRQFISVPARCENDIKKIETDAIRVLEAARHTNKLRTGHLRGNRFNVLVRGVQDGALDTAQKVVQEIEQRGVPNYFGMQRFGIDGRTLETGFALLRGTLSERDLPARQRRFLLKLSLSAVQSHLFNRVLTQRIEDRLAHTVLEGDVMQVAASGGPFVVEDAAAEQARFNARETFLTGPMFGPKMRRPVGEPAQREAAVLEHYGLTDAHFEGNRRLTSGTRRPLLIWPGELNVTAEADGLRFCFTLPAGAYATMVLREVMKTEPA